MMATGRLQSAERMLSPYFSDAKKAGSCRTCKHVMAMAEGGTPAGALGRGDLQWTSLLAAQSGHAIYREAVSFWVTRFCNAVILQHHLAVV